MNVPHAIIPSTSTRTKHDGELGYIGASDSSYELRTVLCNSTLFCICTDHKAGDVLEEDEWDVALSAEFDEVRAFEGRFGEENSVVGDDADLMSVDTGKASDKSCTIVALEFGEFAPINDACDDFMGGDLSAEIGANDAVEFSRVIKRFLYTVFVFF